MMLRHKSRDGTVRSSAFRHRARHDPESGRAAYLFRRSFADENVQIPAAGVSIGLNP